jgi:hypothetical protein
MRRHFPVNFREATAAGKKPKTKSDIEGAGGDLSDLEYDNDLYEKYEHYTETLPQMYATVKEVWQYLATKLSAQEFDRGNQTIRMFGFGAGKRSGVDVAAENIAKTPSQYYRQVGSIAEIEIPLPQINTTLLTNKDREGNSEKFTKSLKVINQFFPDLKAPTLWKQDEIKDPQGRILFKKLMPQFNTLKGKDLKVSEIIKMRLDLTNDVSVEPPSLPKEFKKWDDTVIFRLEIDERNTKLNISPFDMDDVPQGPMATIPSNIDLYINVRCFLRYPLEFAAWSTCTVDRDDYVPYYFVRHHNSKHRWYNDSRARNKNIPADRISHLSELKRLADRNRKLGLIENPRANQEEFVLTKEGTIVWVPKVDNTTSYIAAVKKSYDPNNNKIIPLSEIPELHNKPVYTDWLSRKYTVSLPNGELHTIDLNSSRPLDDVTIARLIQVPLISSSVSNLVGLVENASTKLNININGTSKRPDSLYSELQRVEGLTLGQLAQGKRGVAADQDSWVDDNLGYLRTYIEQVWKSFDKLDIPFVEKVLHYRLGFFLVLKYGKEKAVYQRKYEESINKNRAIAPHIPLKTPIKIPNLPGLKSLMPSQVKVLRELQTKPKSAIIQVDAGGGKTISIITDILNLLSDGTIKRPVVFAPGNLVRVWVAEINNISQGKLNAFPFRKKVYERMVDSGMDNSQIIAYLSNLPKNTIIITDYKFMSMDGASTIYLDDPFYTFPYSELIYALNPDYVALDESHKVKNEESLSSQAAVAATSGAEYTRTASGTVIFNTAVDLVGQANIHNPAIFMGKQRFMERFGEEVSGGKVRVWKDDVAQLINQALVPYVKKVNLKRREWAFLLPKINEYMEYVSLTPNQKDFYDKQMVNILADIRKDPKIQKMLAKGELAEEELENELRRYLAKVEIFINAPGENEAFASLSTTKPADLLSPCVDYVNKLINVHFKGGMWGTGSNQERIEPSKWKIIIVGYNTAVSAHIFKHLEQKGRALHYRAGDELVIEEFRKNPKYDVLVADENSMKEGYNLQVADRVVHLQVVWTPGELEQLIARAMRPDPRGDVKRNSISLHHCLINNTLEIAKMARLMSKIITTARIEEGNNPEFTVLEANLKKYDLPLVSMNLDTLAAYTNFKELDTFFNAYKEYKIWEDYQFNKARDTLKANVEKELGKKVTYEELSSLAMHPVDGSYVLPGSKENYTPWINGVSPADPYKLQLLPLSDIQSEDEEDDESTDNIEVGTGDVVMTEFGPAWIKSVRKKSVRVMVPGIAEEHSLPKGTVYYIQDAKKRAAIEKQLRSSPLSLLAPNLPLPDSKKLKPTPPTNFEELLRKATKKEDGEKTAPEKTAADEATAEIHVSVINGKVWMWAPVTKGNSAIFGKRGFKRIEKAKYATVKNYKQMNEFIETLYSLKDEGKIVVSEKALTDLERIFKIMQTNKNALNKVKPSNYAAMRDFLAVINHKVFDDKKRISPYVLVWDELVHIMVDFKTQPLAARLPSMIKVAGVRWADFDAHMFKMLPNKDGIKEEVKRLQKLGLEVENSADLDKEIRTIR